MKNCSVVALSAYLGSVCSETALRSESFAANIAVEGPVLRPFYLGVMVPQMLLEVRQLDKGSTTLWKMTSVRSFP